MRPYYRLADNVHAGIMGALYKLGTVQRGKLLLEPTPVGLEEPGQNTALALAVCVAQLLRVCPALDALVIARTAQIKPPSSRRCQQVIGGHDS